MKNFIGSLILLSVFSFFSASSALALEPTIREWTQTMYKKGDYIGLRVYLKKLMTSKQLSPKQSLLVKQLIFKHPDELGFDLMYVWNSLEGAKTSELDRQLDGADAQMLAGKFKKAFAGYQDVARRIKKGMTKEKDPDRKLELETLYPFVLQSMGRALFGDGRYRDAYVVYSWLEPLYPRFRQTLFERMWVSFRLGRADLALGAIASQHSAYFSRFLPSESYLVQNYIYRKLCRTKELEPLVEEMKLYESAVSRNDVESWATTDLEHLALWRLSHSPFDIPNREISESEKSQEQEQIRQELEKTFKKEKPKILKDLKIAMAFVELSDTTGNSVVLRQIDKLPSRDSFLEKNLEIWPADSGEQWADEIGSYHFFGESRCVAKPKS